MPEGVLTPAVIAGLPLGADRVIAEVRSSLLRLGVDRFVADTRLDLAAARWVAGPHEGDLSSFYEYAWAILSEEEERAWRVLEDGAKP